MASRGPGLALAAFCVCLLVANVFVVPYPTDNDLDEIGWIAAHQTWDRPESLVNQNYPFGFPFLLNLLIPIVGSLVTAAFVYSTIGATLWVWLVFRLTGLLTNGDKGTALVASATTAVVLLPLAMSEFADNLTTALLLAGLCAVVARPQSSRAVAVFGVCAGLGMLLRFHFLLMLVIGPVALSVLRDTMRDRARAGALFLAGFAVGALPLLVLNIWVRGQPLHTGLTPYMIGWFTTNSIDWTDFLATYDLWPLSRVVRERPASLAQLLYHHAQLLLERPEIKAGLVLVPLSITWALQPAARRAGAFLATVFLLYMGAIILPSQFSTRAVAPATCLLCVLAFPAITRLSELLPAGVRIGRLPAVRFTWIAAVVVVLFVGINNPLRPALDKREALAWNRTVLDAMRAHGWNPGARVFSNVWEFYPLEDPRFVTFHNYGGYMLLDPLYNDTMPRPDAHDAIEWQAFFDRHGIEFVAAKPGDAIQEFFDRRDPSMWPEVFHDDRIVVLKRMPPLQAPRPDRGP